MSSGANCGLYEKTPGKWFYDLQQWPYGDNPDRDTFGPFTHFNAALTHLDRNHQNPGGWSVTALPGCKHDMRKPTEFRHPGDTQTDNCGRCGSLITSLDFKTWRTEFLTRFRKTVKEAYFKYAGEHAITARMLFESGSTPENVVFQERYRINMARFEAERAKQPKTEAPVNRSLFVRSARW